MRILVPIKRVTVLSEDFELEDGVVDPADLEPELNDWDRFSVQAAVDLAAGDGDEIVVVTVGDDDAEEELRSCMALGAHRGIRAWSDALAAGDPLAVARVLAAVVEREQPDLVLCGAQSSDSAHGATGIALAGFADLTHVAVVRHVERDGAGLLVHRELEGGVVERLAVDLPALLTVQTGINEPGYATLRQIKQANQLPLDVLDLDDLGLDAAELAATAGVESTTLAAPERLATAQMLDGSAEEIAGRIAAILREEAQR